MSQVITVVPPPGLPVVRPFPVRLGERKRKQINPKWVPTPLVSRLAPRRIPLAEPSPVPPQRRSRQVFRLLGGYLLWLSAERKKATFSPAAAGALLRERLQELGGIWVKVGQLLSLRSDGFPAEFCAELSKLQHRAVGFPAVVARRLVEQELGRSIEELFHSFEDVPLAAASISQVHRAVLHNGATVAVKIQRPDVEAFFNADMAVLQRIVRWLDRLGIMAQMRWHEAITELDYVLREEVDFRYEADNARRLRKSLKRHRVYVPYVYRKLSTKRVLVMEFLSGVLMSDFLETRRQEPYLVQLWLHTNNIEPKRLGRNLYKTAMRQLLEDNLFHADLHPGNIMLLKDGRLALIDLGTVGQLDYEFLQTYKLSLKAMAAGDWAQAVDLNLLLCPVLPSVGMADLRRDLIVIYRNWVSRAQLTTMPYAEKSLSSVGKEAGRLMYAHQAAPSWAFLRVSRTWTTLDSSLNELVTDISYVDLFKRYFAGAQRRENDPRTLGERMAARAAAADEAATASRIWQVPLGRRQVLATSARTGKAPRLVAGILNLLALGLLVVWLFSTGVVVRAIASRDASLNFSAILNDLPHLESGWWVIIMLVSLVVAGWGRRMAKSLKAIELRN